MTTLTISDIFSHLNDYKKNYLEIISHPDQYFTPVEAAYIHVWPLGHIPLYLGDLLQLWFSEKWLIDEPCLRLSDHPDDGRKLPLQRSADLYLYQLSGSALSGSNRSQVWSISEQRQVRVSLSSALKYYCIYKGTNHQQLDRKQLIQALKSAI